MNTPAYKHTPAIAIDRHEMIFGPRGPNGGEPYSEPNGRNPTDEANAPKHPMPGKVVKLSRRGIPVNTEDWTEGDWFDLHRATEAAIRKIAKRHRVRP